MEVARLVHQVVEALDVGGHKPALIHEQYRWIFNAAHSVSVSEGTHGRRTADDGSAPGPTAGVAASKEHVRKLLAEAADKLGDAVDSIRFAKGLLARAEAGLQPRIPLEPDRRHPRTATRADLQGSREAQARRGQGFGED